MMEDIQQQHFISTLFPNLEKIDRDKEKKYTFSVTQINIESHTQQDMQDIKITIRPQGRPAFFVVQVMGDISKQDCIHNKRIPQCTQNQSGAWYTEAVDRAMTRKLEKIKT